MAAPPSSLNAEIAVRADDLTKSYGSTGSPVYALRGVSFEVADGERVALLGKSGSGKSTLLNLLGGLDHATSGALRVGGLDVDRLSRRALSRFRSATVGMIFQSFNLIPSLSALQNVELPMNFAGRSPRDRRALVNGPRIVLADEPTGELDTDAAREVMGLILDHVETHRATLVLVTHDEELAAASTTRVLRLLT